MREYWMEHGFVEMHSPKLMGSPSESGAELFELPYFDRKAYLAQSPQFFKQMAMAAGFERVFEIAPAFRADPSFTSRHMTEFTSVDVEISWINSHEDVMDHFERWMQSVYKRVKEAHGERIQELLGVDLVVPEIPFPRISMDEAHGILEEVGYRLPPDKRDEIDPGGERALSQYVKEHYNSGFCFLTDWPISVRPFYHMRHPDNPNLTRSFDLIIKGLEISTGRTARAPLRGAQGPGAGQGPDRGADLVLPGLLPLRNAAARRLRSGAVAAVDGDAQPEQRARGGVSV